MNAGLNDKIQLLATDHQIVILYPNTVHSEQGSWNKGSDDLVS